MQARQFLEESNREGNEEMHGEPEDAEAFEAVEVVEASAEAGESVEAVDAVKGGEEMPDSGATGSDREEI